MGKVKSEADTTCSCERKECATIGEMRMKAEELGQNLSANFESQFHSFMDNLSNSNDLKKKKGTPYYNEFDEKGMKKFIARESILTELLQIDHIQTIYNVFAAVLFVYLINTMLYDYLETGSLLDFSIMSWAFGKRSVVAWNWLKMQSCLLLLYPLFFAYANNQLSPSWQRLPGYIWFIGYLIYLAGFIYFPVHVIFSEELPPASAFIIITEQVRFLMKSYAFVRVNSGKVSSCLTNESCEKTEKCRLESANLPGFSQYIYFLFIPTLIYRDRYPMTPYIRWNFVVKNFMQVIGCIFYAYFVIVRLCMPIFRNTGKEKGDIKTLLLSSFSCMLPGVLILLVTFFAVLHCWMNAFAEMMRFADRMFYRDWWNSNSFSSYYRMWNVVVHDWLHAYVYKDLVEIMGAKYQVICQICVFAISAIAHEYILTVAMGFFFPVLLLMFGGAGLFLFFLKPTKGSTNPLWNVYLWIMLTVGMGILMALYSVEWFASKNCTKKYEHFVEYLLPYSIDSRCVVWEWKKT